MPRVVNNKSATAATNNNGDDVPALPPLPTTTTTNTNNTTAAPTSTSTLLKSKSIQRSLKSSIAFKSDLNKSTRTTWSCGILHAVIVTTPPVADANSNSAAGGTGGATVAGGGAGGLSKEEHCFTWICNLTHLSKALDHLKQFGFYHDDSEDATAAVMGEGGGEGTIASSTNSSITFIPYSSRSNWCYKYPMAFPNIHVDMNGNVTGYPYWNPDLMNQPLQIPFSSAGNSGASSAFAASGGGSNFATIGAGAGGMFGNAPTIPALPPLPTTTATTTTGDKLFPNASLSNDARNQLHSQIYNYFSWMKSELVIGQSAASAVGGSDTSMINGLDNLLNVMESTFGESVVATASSSSSSGSGRKRKAVVEDTPPLLEYGLIDPLNQLVAKNVALEQEDEEDDEENGGGGNGGVGGLSSPSSPKRRKKNTTGGRSSTGGGGGSAPLDFDDMYQRLLTFKAAHGHVNVPQGYKEDKQLGSWVTNIRYKRKCLQKSGLEYEVDDEKDDDEVDPNELMGGASGGMSDFDAATATMLGMDLPTKKPSSAVKPKRKKKRLSQERVAQLDDIGFQWSHDKQYKSWDERFNDLQEYLRVNGNTRVPRSSGSLGEWVHMQRKLYHKNDKNFLAKRAPKLESIGFEWRTRKYDLVSWDENFQNLMKFGTENQHYNVPAPIEGSELTKEQEEANRFYKWVKRTRAEYKSLVNGKSSRMLTEDRVAKLRQIGFIV